MDVLILLLVLVALIVSVYSLITSRGGNLLAWGVLALSLVHLIPAIK